jgi:DNA replication and repair protein RecF
MKFRLKALELHGYKSHTEAKFDFGDKMNCFTGRNGAGKTNVLDAIYLLCMTKSPTGLMDKQLVQHEAEFYRVDGRFERDGRNLRVVVKCPANGKKSIESDGQSVVRFSDHIGKLPVVMIAPDDVQLVTESGEMRRKFMDTTLSQVSQDYLNALISYNTTLKQRNALLKHAAETNHMDHGLLDIYDKQMEGPAYTIFAERRRFFDAFAPVFAQRYAEIANDRELVAVRYESVLEDQAWHEIMLQRREKDRLLQRTTQGIHRDDLLMLMDDQPVRSFGSQGQLKSYLLALRLAQYAYLSEVCQQQPILLLDDIFDKLDMHRVEALLQVIQSDAYGQIFITDTQKSRLEVVTAELGNDVRFFELG